MKQKRSVLLWLLVIVLLGFSCVASLAYYKLQRDSARDLALLKSQQKQNEKRLEKMLRARDDLESNVDELKLALDQMKEQEEMTARRIEEFRQLLIKFKSVEGLSVEMDRGRMVLRLSSDVLFASGQSKLSGSGEKTIRQVARILKDIKNRRFQIEGHTDSDQIFSPEKMTNWELAANRALNVLHTMVEEGMPAERISAASYGSSLPVAVNHTRSGKQKNRRIEVVVVPDLSELPGAEELEKLAVTRE